MEMFACRVNYARVRREKWNVIELARCVTGQRREEREVGTPVLPPLIQKHITVLARLR
jgi:hypothetical protein